MPFIVDAGIEAEGLQGLIGIDILTASRMERMSAELVGKRDGSPRP
jgi:hypothetical protein